ncbi:hypothetical protein LguiB_011611 [Lonicera macranthoides]
MKSQYLHPAGFRFPFRVPRAVDHPLRKQAMVNRDRSRAVYVGFDKGVLAVRLEFKEFRFQVTEHGSMVSITEITRSKSYRIIIDFKVAEWVSRELKKAAGGVESNRFSSKFQLPACKNGEGWLKVAEVLLKIIYRPGNIQVNNRAVGCYAGRKTEQSTQSSKQKFTVGTRLDEQVIVCTRESLWHDWVNIQEAINRQFKEAIRMQPFQPDKAVIQCKSEESALKLGRSKRVLFFEGRAVCLQAWDQNEVMLNRKLAFTGGWIEFTDLPLNWWRREVFEKIGNQCGGLLTIDKSTVKIDLVGKGEEKCTIRLKLLSKLNLKNMGKFNKIPELGVFDRCIIGVVDFNGGQGRDQVPNACEIGDVSHKYKAINEGMGNIELYRRENESAGIIEGTCILQEGRGKMGEFIGEGSNCGTTVNEKEGVTGFAEDIGWEYWGKGKMKEGDRVFNDGGSSHVNLLNSGMVEIEGETGFTVKEEGKRAGLDWRADNRESDGEGSFVDSSSDEEGLKTHNFIDNCDGDNDWLARFFFDGEADSHVGVNNVDSERRYARREGKQLVLHGLNEGSPAASISYSFGNSNGVVFTIYRGGYEAEILANKLTMSVFYEKVVRRRNEVDNLVEIQTIIGSNREDSSKNKMGASSNIVQVEKENVVENGGNKCNSCNGGEEG